MVDAARFGLSASLERLSNGASVAGGGILIGYLGVALATLRGFDGYLNLFMLVVSATLFLVMLHEAALAAGAGLDPASVGAYLLLAFVSGFALVATVRDVGLDAGVLMAIMAAHVFVVAAGLLGASLVRRQNKSEKNNG